MVSFAATLPLPVAACMQCGILYPNVAASAPDRMLGTLCGDGTRVYVVEGAVTCKCGCRRMKLTWAPTT